MRVLAFTLLCCVAAACTKSRPLRPPDGGAGSDGAVTSDGASPRDGAAPRDGSIVSVDGGVRRDGGVVVNCVSGDAFDLGVCDFAESFCAYGASCPSVGAPAGAMCVSTVRDAIASMRSSVPDVAQCGRCLEAIAAAFVDLRNMAICPPPPEPPASVADPCDVNPAVDSDGDGVPGNDLDACGFGVGG